MTRTLASRAGLVASVALAVVIAPAGCTCDPGEVPATDASRTRRDAAIDAPSFDAPGPDAPGPDAPGPDAFLETDDAAFTDGCVSEVSLDRAGLPCLDDTDCPASLSCIEGGSFASCELLASVCACPEGSMAFSSVSASGVITVCRPLECPARTLDASAIGRACTTLRDCPEWMVCEGSGGAQTCALPCSTQCTCPGTTRCESVVTAAGISTRCVP